MAKPITRIHFNVLKPLDKNYQKLLKFLTVLIVMVVSSLAIKFGIDDDYIILGIYVINILIPTILITKHLLFRDKVIAKASISPTKIVLGNEVFKFDEIQMCWIHIGIIRRTTQSGHILSFEDVNTLIMTIIQNNGKRRIFHIENERKYPKLLSDLLKDLIKEHKLSKIQFHLSKKFDEKELNRRRKNNK